MLLASDSLCPSPDLGRRHRLLLDDSRIQLSELLFSLRVPAVQLAEKIDHGVGTLQIELHQLPSQVLVLPFAYVCILRRLRDPPLP